MSTTRDLTGKSAAASAHRVSSPVRIFLLTVLASLLLESAWILAVPPFVGMDENQHATKAAAVAHGDFSPRHPLAGKYGGVVEAPEDLVLAAQADCLHRNTTDRYNCKPIEQVGNGMVTVTTTAATYSPVFYALVGTAGRPFAGLASFYAMRACGAFLCALMIGLAMCIVSRWATTLAPLVAFQVATVPVLWYSVSILAPNGLEMCCGLVLWAALLGILRNEGSPDRLTIVAGTFSACLLAILRGAGPLWLALIVVAVSMITHRSTWRVLANSDWPKLSAAAIALAVLGGLGWSFASIGGMHALPTPNSGTSAAATMTGLPTWAIGSFAMYPGPREPAPIMVYIIGLAVWGSLLTASIRHARTGIRLSAAFVLVCAAFIPVILTLKTYHQIGLFWQGRYALPFTLGVGLLLGYALDETGVGASIRLTITTIAGTLVMNFLSLAAIVHNYQPYRYLFPDWPSPNPALVAVLVSASMAAMTVALRVKVLLSDETIRPHQLGDV